MWFGEPLISATADEVRRLIIKAKEWAESRASLWDFWLSDRQDAFVTGIAAEFPDVPYRYCENHFLRDVAKPVLEADSHTKVQIRKKVRGLRKIEQAVLKRQGVEASGNVTGDDTEATIKVPVASEDLPLPGANSGRCSGTRLLHGSAWHSQRRSGWTASPSWLADGRGFKRSPANRSNGTWTKKKGIRGKATRLLGWLHRLEASTKFEPEQETIRDYVKDIEE